MSGSMRVVNAVRIACLLSAMVLMGETVVLAAGSGSSAEGTLAQEIVETTGVKGGLVVQLGCGDGKLTAALHSNDSYLVHGLDTDAGNVEAARKTIQSLGLYGNVSVEQWSGKDLPYIGNSVNLLVSENPVTVSNDEILRVLVPGGVAYVKSGGKWARTVKPRPKGMDEWTHYLHDPTNNAVAHDSLIEPPAHYQWVGSERYSRQHDHMSSVSATVTANGRFFAIFDEAPRASILTPSDWHLIARDAFNGTLLWKRDIDVWHEHLWPLKSGPQLMTRRLVAVGDRVYVTLSVDGPLLALDAASGKTIRTYEGTKATEEILCDGGVLFLSVAADGQPLRSDPKRVYADLAEIKADVTNPLWTDAPRTIMAVDAESGKVLWKKVSTVVSESLCADRDRVLFHDGQRIQCLDRNNGQVLWASEPLPRHEGMRSSSGVTLVSYGDVILYSGMVAAEKYEDRRETTMFAISAKDGKTLWKAEHPPCGHMGTPDDILVAGGLVWSGAVAQGSDSGIMTGRDLHTGEVKIEFPPDVETHWFHHRCYRAKATDKYLLFSRTGIEFIDYAKQHWICHHWVRGACLYGIMPANGLIYAPPHPCACYIEAKLYGFSALAPANQDAMPRLDVPDSERLQRGPAYGEQGSGLASAEDWPTFRHDVARSGSSKTAVPPTGLKRCWEAELGGKLSSPVVADGKLLVASVDAHAVHALEAGTGKPLWSFTAGGRVDSPPTVWQGRALFGSADGYVYCVRASDGQLIWRYRVAPEERRMGGPSSRSSRSGPCTAVCWSRTTRLIASPVARCSWMAACGWCGWTRRRAANFPRRSWTTAIRRAARTCRPTWKGSTCRWGSPTSSPATASTSTCGRCRSTWKAIENSWLTSRSTTSRATTCTCSAPPASWTTRSGIAPTGSTAGRSPPAPAATAKPGDSCRPAGSSSATTTRSTATGATGSTTAGPRRWNSNCSPSTKCPRSSMRAPSGSRSRRATSGRVR